MKYFCKTILQYLLDQNFKKRRLILILFDSVIISLSFWLSYLFSFDKSELNYLSNINNSYFVSLISGIIIYIFTGHYKSLIKYSNSISIYTIFFRHIYIVLTLYVINMFGLKINYLGSKFYILMGFIATNLSILIRLIIKDLILNLEFSKFEKRTKVAIYGAGEAGAKLSLSLGLSGKWKVVNFIDDSKYLWNRTINGIPVISKQTFEKNHQSIQKVLLAIPSLSKSRRREIIESLENKNFTVLSVPSIDELSEGNLKIDNLNPISIEDLLSRDPVNSDSRLLEQGIKNYNILVTGAGGSIGSELCRYICKLKPSKIILLERNEPSLYSIKEQLKKQYDHSIIIKPILGNTLNKNQLIEIFNVEKIDIVFHAAAYKHVPIIEDNPIEGIENNIFSTLNICEVCNINKIKKMVLISTDKAVRPTNIMGASKRVAELIVQNFSINKNSSAKLNTNTCFTMVRFGNVLNSSGSVVPLFKEQIKKGGPITVTDKKVERFFMTIPEAAQLVIQASIMAEGGDLFLLEMGEPVKIIDLATRMIKLSGLTIKNSQNPKGDIEMVFTGLRKGEKLYEELLVDAKAISTQHPRIFKAKEKVDHDYDTFWVLINKLENSVKNRDLNAISQILKKLVPEWQKK